MFDRLRAKVKGYRTFLASGAMSAGGAIALLGNFDLTPLIQLIVRNPETVPLAVLLVGIFFGVLRYFTDTAPFDHGDGSADLKTDQGE
jgi:hypothetical protein